MTSLEDAFYSAFTSLYNQQHQENKINISTITKPITPASLLQQFLSLQSTLLSSDAYSLNESVKELPSSSIRYLIVQYELANLWQNQPITPEPIITDQSSQSQVQSEARISQAIERRKHLNKSVTTFMSFLSTCDHLDALSDDDRTAYLTIKSKFEGHGEQLMTQTPYNASAIRANKIVKFKQNRELENQMAAFEAKHAALLFTGADSHTTKSITSNENDADSDLEDQMREYWLARLQYSINKALESIPLSLQEQEFLIERETREREGQSIAQSNSQSLRQAQNQSVAPPSKPLVYSINSASELSQPIPDHMKQYLQHVQQPSAPSTTNQRTLPPGAQSIVKTVNQPSPFDMQNLLTSVNDMSSRPTRATVFRDPNPATISVEEWADGEIAAGRMPGPSAPVRMKHRRGYVTSYEDDENHDVGDEDEQELAGQFGGERDRFQEDAKTIKDREWDNWKDDHERGAGNRSQTNR